VGSASLRKKLTLFAVSVSMLAMLALSRVAAAKPRSQVGPMWSESHEIGDDVRFELDARGGVTASRVVRLQVTGGAVRELDVDGVPVSAALDDAPSFIAEDGTSFPARVAAVEARPSGVSAIRIAVSDVRGLRRGVYSITLRYTFDGIKEGLLTPGPSAWKFSWTTPPARDGRDSVKVAISLPRGDITPRDIAGPHSATLFRTTRFENHDEAELTRAHVTRGEAVTWAMLLDAAAFEGVRKAHRALDARAPHPTELEGMDANARAVPGRDMAIAFGLASLV